MADNEKEEKGFLGRALDRLTGKDDKEDEKLKSPEKTARELAQIEEAKKRIEDLKASDAEKAKEMAKKQAEVAAEQKMVAEKRADEMEEKLKDLEEKERREKANEMRQKFAEERAERAAAEAKKAWKQHTVEEGETLSHISLKYYGSAVKDKWMVIYEANKDVIGDNPNQIRPGMELDIPELDD